MAKRKGRMPPDVLAYLKKMGAEGGAIGGKRRFAKLSAEEKTALAKKAAATRWAKVRRKKT